MRDKRRSNRVFKSYTISSTTAVRCATSSLKRVVEGINSIRSAPMVARVRISEKQGRDARSSSEDPLASRSVGQDGRCPSSFATKRWIGDAGASAKRR